MLHIYAKYAIKYVPVKIIFSLWTKTKQKICKIVNQFRMLSWCRIVTHPYSAYSAHICTPHFANGPASAILVTLSALPRRGITWWKRFLKEKNMVEAILKENGHYVVEAILKEKRQGNLISEEFLFSLLLIALLHLGPNFRGYHSCFCSERIFLLPFAHLVFPARRCDPSISCAS